MTFVPTGCAETKFGGKAPREAFPDQRVARMVEAAIDGELSAVDRQIQAGADVNAIGHQGLSPLIWVLATHKLKGAEHLLKAGANPNYVMPESEESAMSLAAGGQWPDALELLLKYGGNPNLRGPKGNPLLNIAASEPRRENINLLLLHGADINGHRPDGGTAAQSALITGNFELVAYLLERGLQYNLHDLAQDVEIVQVPPQSEQQRWKEKVIDMLKARGIKFPAFIRKKPGQPSE